MIDCRTTVIFSNKKKERTTLLQLSLFCTPAGVRTLDTLIKSQVLYQLSYKRIFSAIRHRSRIAVAKVRTFHVTAKLFCVFFLQNRIFGPVLADN